MTDPQLLISQYLFGSIANEQAAELACWLKADAANAEIFAAETYIHRRVRDLLAGAENCRVELQSHSQEISSTFFESVNVQAVLEAAEQERVARDDRARVHAEQEAKRLADLHERRHLRRLMSGRSELMTPVRHIVIPKAVFYGAIAAVVALAAMLFWPDQSPTPQHTDVKPTAPQLVQVATLVEQMDAKWLGISTSGGAPGGNSPAPGDALLNQPMHLVSGLAKLRFNNEAEVILEAPCSIEPISGGEIKITHGKLVGRCETATSKGFVVQTPRARIVDYGTEFGVSVDQDGDTEAHVFDGTIATTLNNADSEQIVTLRRNETWRINAQGLFQTDSPKHNFARRIVRLVDLLDVVAGGDGMGNASARGIDLLTGSQVDRFEQSLPGKRKRGNNRYMPVTWHPLIDGVFIPDGEQGAVTINSSGVNFNEFENTDNYFLGPLWVRRPEDPTDTSVQETENWVGSIVDISAFALSGEGLLAMHANAGVTFDLDALQKMHPDWKADRFIATVANAQPQASLSAARLAQSQVRVFTDGRLMFDRRRVNLRMTPFKLDIELKNNPQFLTIVVSDDDGDFSYDWVVVGDPVIELVPAVHAAP